MDLARAASEQWGIYRGYDVYGQCQGYTGYYMVWMFQGNEDGIQTWTSAKNALLASTIVGTDMNPPAGAICFWDDGYDGHTGVSAGNGYFIDTTTFGVPVMEFGWGATLKAIRDVLPDKYVGWAWQQGGNTAITGLEPYGGGGGGGGGDYAYGLTYDAQLATQKALTRLGFYDGDIDGVFGHWSVLGFQEYLGRGSLGLLPADYSYDGIPGYYYGVAVQELAARFGYTGPIDGIPGEMTSLGIVNWANSVLAVTPEPPVVPEPVDDPWGYRFSELVSRTATYGFPDHKWRAKKIHGMVLHHVAGTDGWAYVSNPNDRDSHPTYHIKDDIIGGVVPPSKRPTSSGNSIDEAAETVEIANSSTGGDWPISLKSMESLIALIVDRAYTLGFREIVRHEVGVAYGDNLYWVALHSDFVATACPGPYVTDRTPEIIAEADRRLGLLLNPGTEEPEEPNEPEEPEGPEEPEEPETPATPRPEDDDRIEKEASALVTEAAKNVVLSEKARAFLWWTILVVGVVLLGVQAWFVGIEEIPPKWYYGAANVALVVLPVVGLLARANMPNRNEATAEKVAARQAKAEAKQT